LLSDLYAVAALAGASVVVVGHILGLSYDLSALAGWPLCFGLRFMAIKYGWHLPVAHLARGRAVKNPSDDGNPTKSLPSIGAQCWALTAGWGSVVSHDAR
jgi:hypothetical protein